MADEDLRDAVAALQSLGNTSQALQATVIAEMGRRAAQQDEADAARSGYYETHCTEEFIVDELAVMLSISRQTAGHLYDRAVRTSRSPSLMATWHRGVIDGRKAESIAHTIAVCGEGLPRVELEQLIDSAVEYAVDHTPPQLREWLRRRQIAAYPEAAERRRELAIQGRRVSITHLDDGVSELWALLPTVGARLVQQVLDQVAREASSRRPDESMDQRRADALVELVTGETDPPPAHVQVVVPADVLAGTSDQPAWMPGVGPVTATEARALAGQGLDRGNSSMFRRLLVDPSTGVLTDVAEKQYRPSSRLDRAVRARDLTCRFPGCRRSALGSSTGTDLDHTVPWPHGPTSATNLAVLCRRHHRLKHSPGWECVLHPDGTMTWVTPAGRRYRSEPWQYVEPQEQSPPQLE